MALSKKEQDKLITGVYDGVISLFNLPEFLFNFTYEQIIFSVDKGFKVGEMIANKQIIYDAFKHNIGEFGGSKTVAEVQELTQLVFNDDGTKRVFEEFEKIAREKDFIFNEVHLKAEQDTAFSQAQSADRWVRNEQMKDTFPLLQYVTVGDSRVRDQHAAWNGIIKPLNDSFWDTRNPVNDWKCRCRTIRVKRGETTNLNDHLKTFNKNQPEGEKIKSLKNPSKVFNINSAKEKKIFKVSGTNYEKTAKSTGLKRGTDNYGLGNK